MHASQSGNQRLTSGLFNGDAQQRKRRGSARRITPPRTVCSIKLMLLLVHSGSKQREGTEGAVPRVTLLYTLLNLTGVDATLGWRATVESELECKK